MDINTPLMPCWLLTLLSMVIVKGGDRCSWDTGYSTITDARGYPHNVYISATRDGSIWLRVGQDHKAQDWVYSNEEQRRFVVHLINETTSNMLEYLDYTDACVMTDLRFNFHAYASWHASFIKVYDPDSSQVLPMLFRRNPAKKYRCRTNTTVFLTDDGQALSCRGGPISSCGYGNLIEKNSRSGTLFLTKVQLDPDSDQTWACEPNNRSYTFMGSYYHAYVKLASCSPPTDSREFGHEAKLRAFDDNGQNMVIIPDPMQTALADGVIMGWQVYAKITSPTHSVYLQVWRPKRGFTNNFTLVGQTLFHPEELRFQVIKLLPSEYIQLKKGDVLGLYFPEQNPLAWSPVPCALSAQRTLVLHQPPAPKTGIAEHFKDYFTSGAEGNSYRYACRHYSFTALLSNKTMVKRIEDWICPTAHSWHNGNPAGFDDNSEKPGGDRVTLRPSTQRSPSGDSVPMYLILIMIGGLFLLFLIIGVVSYYRAVQR